MKKLLLSTLLIALTAGAMHASDSVMVRRAVYFGVDAAQLDAAARTQLDSLTGALHDQGEFAISIYGTADVDGAAGYNQQLSERRAKVVREYLLSQNIKAVKCETRGLGSHGDQQSKAENRKVDIEIALTYYSDVEEIFKTLGQQGIQQYVIDAAVPNEITCKGNTKVSIPAGAFTLANGDKVTGKVTVTVKEALSMTDFLTQDLSSVSDGRLLESRGMVYVNANSDGRAVALGNSSPITVSIPASSITRGMKLFYGARGSDNTMNWKVQNADFSTEDKIVQLNIDRAPLRRAHIRVGGYPVMPHFADVKEPVKPGKPRAPLAVKEPVHGSFYPATNLEKVFTKKKIADENEKIYQMAQKRYDEYLVKKAAYDEKVKDYDKVLKKYEADVKVFEAGAKERFDAAAKYFHAMYEYQATNEINTRLTAMEALPITNKTQLTAQSNLGENYPANEQQQMEQIIGSGYYQHYKYSLWGLSTGTDDRIIVDGKSNYRIEGYQSIYDSIYNAKHIYTAVQNMQTSIMNKCANMGLLRQKNVDNYVAAVSQLGWINCDRFVETPAAMLVNVKVKEDDNVKMYMVFHDINSCLPISGSQGLYVSSRVPKGRQVSIVAIKVRNGKPQLAVAQVNTSKTEPIQLEYKTCSLDDIRSSFASVKGS